jgi:hypothetical protein
MSAGSSNHFLREVDGGYPGAPPGSSQREYPVPGTDVEHLESAGDSSSIKRDVN